MDTTDRLIAFGFYLAFGWVFVHWFVNYFLDDGRWADNNRKPTGTELVLIHLFWLLMLLVLIIGFTAETASKRKRSVIQWFYGIKE